MLEIRAVIFDLGRVLVDLDFSKGLFGLLTGTSGEPDEQFVQKVLADELYVSFCTGKIGPEEFHQALGVRNDLDLGFDEFTQIWCEVLVPMPGMDRLVAEVAERLPVGLLSDTDPIHWANQLQVQPWLGKIPKPTLSYRTGLLKPDPGCYAQAAKNAGQPLAQCLFIDDLERNVSGAQAAGMQAIRFEGEEALRVALGGLGILKGVS